MEPNETQSLLYGTGCNQSFVGRASLEDTNEKVFTSCTSDTRPVSGMFRELNTKKASNPIKIEGMELNRVLQRRNTNGEEIFLKKKFNILMKCKLKLI